MGLDFTISQTFEYCFERKLASLHILIDFHIDRSTRKAMNHDLGL